MTWLGVALLVFGAVIVLLLRQGLGPVSGRPLGEIGERIRLSATIVDIRPYERYEREFRAYKFRTDDGEIATWFTGQHRPWRVGDRVSISGTVASHRPFRRRLETIIENVREVKRRQ